MKKLIPGIYNISLAIIFGIITRFLELMTCQYANPPGMPPAASPSFFKCPGNYISDFYIFPAIIIGYLIGSIFQKTKKKN